MVIAGSAFLVTGGSSGLGAACVRKLTSRGARVVIADLSPPRDELSGIDPALLHFQRTDVTSEQEMQAAVDAACERGPLRGAIMCAGILFAERVLTRNGPAPLDGFRRVIEINLVGTFNAARLAAAAMAAGAPDEQGERGALIMTSSIAAWDGQIGQSGYAAAKGGVSSLAVVLARELARDAIRAVAIAPGVFETPMMQAAPEKVRASLLTQALYPQRFGLPDEFAALALHVLENPMLNACTLRLDGGMRMGAR